MNTEMHFLQSDLRHTLQRDVYKNSTFQVELFGQKARGVVKQKSIGPVKLQWYQVLGVKAGDALANPKAMHRELQALRQQLSQKRGDIMVQVGFVDELDTMPVSELKNQQLVEKVRHTRIQQEKNLKKEGRQASFRENMPLSSVILDLKQPHETLVANCSKTTRYDAKKAGEQGLQMHIANDEQRDEYYQLRSQTAKEKGFHIMGAKTYERLRDFCQQTKNGWLLVATHQGHVVAGCICVRSGEQLVYLYGAAARIQGLQGAHKRLLLEICKRAAQQDITSFDLFGTAPTGFAHHPLQAVGAFKESFGGTKVDYVGNYDVVLQPALYRVFKMMKSKV